MDILYRAGYVVVAVGLILQYGSSQFRHTAGKDAHAPGFYVHLAPQEVFIGGGIWTPKNPVLDKIRTAIADDSKAWGQVVNDIDLHEYLGGIKGESLKRVPRGYDPDHEYIDDLKRKSFVAFKNFEPSFALTADFIGEVQKVFAATYPLSRFIARALEIAE